MKKNLANWIKYFQMEWKEEDMTELFMENPLLQKAHNEYVKFTQDETACELYENRMKAQRDVASALDSAEEKGKLEGKIEAAKKMLDGGLSVEQVCTFTGLSEDEIRKLQ